jgi:hypothetical protein
VGLPAALAAAAEAGLDGGLLAGAAPLAEPHAVNPARTINKVAERIEPEIMCTSVFL